MIDERQGRTMKGIKLKDYAYTPPSVPFGSAALPPAGRVRMTYEDEDGCIHAYYFTPQGARRLAEDLWNEASRVELETLALYKRGCKIPHGAKYMIASAYEVVDRGIVTPSTWKTILGIVDDPALGVRVSEQHETELCEGNRDVIEVLINDSPVSVRFWMRDEKDPHLWYAPSLFGGVTSKTTEEMLLDYGDLIEDV